MLSLLSVRAVYYCCCLCVCIPAREGEREERVLSSGLSRECARALRGLCRVLCASLSRNFCAKSAAAGLPSLSLSLTRLGHTRAACKRERERERVSEWRWQRGGKVVESGVRAASAAEVVEREKESAVVVVETRRLALAQVCFALTLSRACISERERV